jgi:uncharacterized protein YfaS (alpha-2-macroglobulin family)
MKLDPSFVRSVKDDDDIHKPLLAQDNTDSLVYPYDDILKGEFFYLETDKRIYYPGDIIEVAVHLRTF